MPRRLSIFVLISANFLVSCADTTVTRQENATAPLSLLSVASNRQNEDIVAQQADALSDLSQGIVRASSVKGAKIGAAVGCGISIVSSGNAKRCVTGALTAGAAGAALGHQSGKRQVSQRVDLVSANKLVRSIRATNDGMDVLTTSLPALLKAQDTELENLSFKRDMGTITQAAFEKRYVEIKENRAQLAHSLTFSAAQAKQAGQNLQDAASQGQTGLEWHFGATQHIAKQAASARSSITLL